MDRNGEVRIQRVLAKAVVDIWRDGNEALSGTNHVMGDLAAKIENAGGIILINRLARSATRAIRRNMSVCYIDGAADSYWLVSSGSL
jgi:isoaspartyl peptidase/L-asparaginase-like protein (Ntn-hydrolase superfamily)